MIYDCFQFFNELDIAEIRFEELYGVVDKFVVCESTLTHSGVSKPLYFQENKERFARFSDKIIHVVCDNPTEPEPGHDINWTRERAQRNFIINALNQMCNDSDIIIISDADEIFRASKIEELKQIGSGSYSLEMKCSWYYLNLTSDPVWESGKAIRFSSLKNQYKGNLTAVRTGGTSNMIYNAGWHLSYMGGMEKVQTKLESFAHQEFNVPETKSSRHLDLVIRFGSSVWDKFKEIEPRGNVPYWKYLKPEDVDLPVGSRGEKFKHLFSEVAWTQLLYDCGNLYHLFNLAKDLEGYGEVVDLGCYEGRTSVYLANALPMNNVHCVDLNISNQFYKNMKFLTNGNYVSYVYDALEFIKNFDKPIKVLHLDVVCDSNFVSQIISEVRSKMTEDFLICGYNWEESGVQNSGLNVQTSGKFWFAKSFL